MLLCNSSQSLLRFAFTIAVAALVHGAVVCSSEDVNNASRLIELEERLNRMEVYLSSALILPPFSTKVRGKSDVSEVKIIKRHVENDETEASRLEGLEMSLNHLLQRLDLLNTTQTRALDSIAQDVWGLKEQDIMITAHLAGLITAKNYNLSTMVAQDIAELRTEVDSVQESVVADNRALQNQLAEVSESIDHTVYDDCHAAWESGVRSPGVYTLKPPGYESFDAWCDFDHLHGWAVIQKRYNGSVNFYLPWDDYKNGFGDLNGEYWLGNDNIHALTRTNRKLSIYMMKWNGEEATANYTSFYIDNESNTYRLTISGYSGSAGEDQMSYHNGQSFSTRDRDNDQDNGQNCASDYTGAWWYNNCLHSNLNGVWSSSSRGDVKHIYWGSSWSGGAAIHRTTMRITRD